MSLVSLAARRRTRSATTVMAGTSSRRCRAHNRPFGNPAMFTRSTSIGLALTSGIGFSGTTRTLPENYVFRFSYVERLGER
jgi:hypothetical protein